MSGYLWECWLCMLLGALWLMYNFILERQKLDQCFFISLGLRVTHTRINRSQVFFKILKFVLCCQNNKSFTLWVLHAQGIVKQLLTPSPKIKLLKWYLLIDSLLENTTIFFAGHHGLILNSCNLTYYLLLLYAKKTQWKHLESSHQLFSPSAMIPGLFYTLPYN